MLPLLRSRVEEKGGGALLLGVVEAVAGGIDAEGHLALVHRARRLHRHRHAVVLGTVLGAALSIGGVQDAVHLAVHLPGGMDRGAGRGLKGLRYQLATEHVRAAVVAGSTQEGGAGVGGGGGGGEGKCKEFD